jgi:hypothetical protein
LKALWRMRLKRAALKINIVLNNDSEVCDDDSAFICPTCFGNDANSCLSSSSTTTTATTATTTTTTTTTSTNVSGVKRKYNDVNVTDLMAFTLLPYNSQQKNYIIDNNNVNELFKAYQVKSLGYIIDHFGNLNMQENLNSFLSLSSIILVKKSSNYAGHVKYLDNRLLNAIIYDFQKSHTFTTTFSFPKPLIKIIRNIINEYVQAYNTVIKSSSNNNTNNNTTANDTININNNNTNHTDNYNASTTYINSKSILKLKNAAQISLLQLANEQDNEDIAHIITAISSILSRVSHYDHINDSEQRLTCFIDSFLFLIFQEINNDPHASNKVVSEKKEIKDDASRPDYKINVVTTTGKVKYANCYGEIKTIDAIRKRKEKLAIDTYRIGMFSRNACKKQDMDYVLSYQAVGTFLTFYIMIALYDDLYPMVEIDKIYIPPVVEDLYIVEYILPQLKNIIQVYKRYCFKKASTTVSTTTTTATAETKIYSAAPQYDIILKSLTTTSDKERNCVMDFTNYTKINNIISEYTRRVASSNDDTTTTATSS